MIRKERYYYSERSVRWDCSRPVGSALSWLLAVATLIMIQIIIE